MKPSLKGYYRAYGRTPKRSLGQVFLIERSIQEEILRLARLEAGDTVLEIGPGTGTLTRATLPLVRRLIAVEVDWDLAAYLRASLGSPQPLFLVCADALRFDYERAARRLDTRMTLLGNLPYAISGPLLSRLVDHRAAFCRMVLMLQQEVAERLVAAPSTKAYGSLTVLFRTAFHVRLERHVSRHCFHPIPKVDSALVCCTPRPDVGLTAEEEATFRALNRASFTHRRKTLVNALRPVCRSLFPATEVNDLLRRCDIDPRRRPETLHPEDFHRLARCLHGAPDRPEGSR